MLSHICFEREEHHSTHQMNEQWILEHNGHIFFFFAYRDREHKCYHLFSLVFKALNLYFLVSLFEYWQVGEVFSGHPAMFCGVLHANDYILM